MHSKFYQNNLVSTQHSVMIYLINNEWAVDRIIWTRDNTLSAACILMMRASTRFVETNFAHTTRTSIHFFYDICLSCGPFGV